MDHPDRSKRAAAYVRVSTDGQRYSAHNQLAAIDEYATQKGLTVVCTYNDEGKSGVTTKGRVGLSSLLADVVGGAASFSKVLVLDVTRWGRFQDPDEAAHYEFMCKAAGVEVHYCAEAFEAGATGSIVKQLKRVMAAEYSRELSAKVRRAKQHIQNLGLHQGGPCPYGIARIEVHRDGTPGRVLSRGDRKSRPDFTLRYVPGTPSEVAVVRLAFNLCLRAKMRPRQIAKALNDRGTAYYDGRDWNEQRVRRLLSCELLTGRHWVGKTGHLLGGGRISHPRSNWQLHRVFEPIISQPDFNAARKRRAIWAGPKSDEEMLRDLRTIKAKHGKITTALIDSSPGSHSSYYYKRFGTLGVALRLVGEEPPLNRAGGKLGTRMAAEDLIAALQDFERQHGHVSSYAIRKADHMPCCTTYINHFGSITRAFAAAGVRDCGRTYRKKSASGGPQLVE